MNAKDGDVELKPKDIVRGAIQGDLIDIDQFDIMCTPEDSTWTRDVQWHALENYEKYTKIICKLD